MRPDLTEDRLSALAVLGFLAETLGDMTRRIEAVEAHVAGVIQRGAEHERVRVMALQDLDLVRQMTDDLSRLAARAGTHDGVRRADLATVLRLAALRDRLASAGSRDSRDAGAAGTGDTGRVEFFADGGAP